MTIKPITDGASELTDQPFHFCCFGNFSGSGEDREALRAVPVNRGGWDRLFETVAPRLSLTVTLPKCDDLRLLLQFRSLKDFTTRGLTAQIPLLRDSAALATQAGAASPEAPLDPAALRSAMAGLAILEKLVAAQGGEAVIDLLSMVDIGTDDTEAGLSLPSLKAFFAAKTYDGHDRTKLMAEIESVRKLVLDQLAADPELVRLHGLWRGLKVFLPRATQRVRLSLVDCHKGELCDATYLLFVKPEQGEPLPLDLAFYCEELTNTEDDLHILYYLGRMAEGKQTPFILNAHPGVFGCKHWRHLSHVRDLSGRLNGPAHIKWRKQREEDGAEWLFLAVNPFLLSESDEPAADAAIAAPASFFPAWLFCRELEAGRWPSELLGALGRADIASACLATLDDAQATDLAFEGFCAISGAEGHSTISLQGMTCFGTIKVRERDQTQVANLVPYTLPYRFYAGCCSRFLASGAAGADPLPALRRYAAIEQEADLQFEQTDDQRIFRIKPAFTILGIKPDLVLSLA